MSKSDRPKIFHVTQIGSNKLEVVLEDGRKVDLIVDGQHNPDKILVVYDPLQWDFENCEFIDFGQPYES